MAHLPYTISATFTAGSATVTAATGAFLINVLPGDFVRGPDEKIYFVNAVASNTSLTLDRNYAGTTVTTSVKFAKHSDIWGLVSDANVRLARIEEAMARGYSLQSAASLAIGTGTKVFTGVEAGLNILDGIRLRATSRANTANYMEGVCAYSGSTLTMTVVSGDKGGSGTFADWNINIVGARGATGADSTVPGPPGTGDVTAAAAFATDNRVIRSNGTGKGVQDSSVVIDDSGRIGVGGTTVPGESIETGGYFYANADPGGIIVDAGGNKRFGFVKVSGFAPEIRHSAALVIRSCTTGGIFAPSASVTAISATTAGLVGIGMTGAAYQLQIGSDSAAKPSTSAWTVASDERLKENIVLADLERCWNIVRDIPLKWYNWRDEAYSKEQVADRGKLGWIAQDVQPFFKNAVLPFAFQRPPVEDGVEEYEEQETAEITVERVVVEIETRDGWQVPVAKVITETERRPVVDHVAIVDEAGKPVLREIPGENGAEITFEPVTHAVPRMVKKTRPKMRTETIDDCLSLNADQLYAAMYGALQLAMKKIEKLEAEVAALAAPRD